MGKTIRRSFTGTRMGESTDRKQRLFSSVYEDDIKMVGKKKYKMAPMWNKMMQKLILTNPHHFLTILECTQRECKPHESIFEHYKKMFE